MCSWSFKEILFSRKEINRYEKFNRIVEKTLKI